MPYAANRRVLCPECKKEFVTSNKSTWAPPCPECRDKKIKPKAKPADAEKFFEDCPICGKHYRALMHVKRKLICPKCKKTLSVEDMREIHARFGEVLASSNREYFEKLRVVALQYLKEKYGTESLVEIDRINKTKSAKNYEQWMKLHKLDECPRLHARMVSLPCGQREECFGHTRCPKCPPKAHPPSGSDLWAGISGYTI